MKTVYIVTHGDKRNGADPHMTVEGYRQVAGLRKLLPDSPTAVICGTGARHIEVAHALGLAITQYTPLVGTPDSGEKVGDDFMIRLACGVNADLRMYVDRYLYAAMPGFLAVIPDTSVVCAGRQVIQFLGAQDARSGRVYMVTVDDSGNTATVELL
jgi:hypothetical protein